jgi:uncharacterized protein
MGRDEEPPKSAQARHCLWTSAGVFLDPLRITMETQDVDGEERFVTIGSITRTFRLVVVVYTLRLEDDDETVRIISARKATSNERKFYEKAH